MDSKPIAVHDSNLVLRVCSETVLDTTHFFGLLLIGILTVTDICTQEVWTPHDLGVFRICLAVLHASLLIVSFFRMTKIMNYIGLFVDMVRRKLSPLPVFDPFGAMPEFSLSTDMRPITERFIKAFINNDDVLPGTLEEKWEAAHAEAVGYEYLPVPERAALLNALTEVIERHGMGPESVIYLGVANTILERHPAPPHEERKPSTGELEQLTDDQRTVATGQPTEQQQHTVHTQGAARMEAELEKLVARQRRTDDKQAELSTIVTNLMARIGGPARSPVDHDFADAIYERNASFGTDSDNSDASVSRPGSAASRGVHHRKKASESSAPGPRTERH